MNLRKLISAICLFPLLSSPGLSQEPNGSGESTAAVARKEANAAYSRKDFEKCASLFEEIAHQGSKGTAMNDFYNAACCYGRAANIDKSFEMLGLAVESGYHKVNHMKGDSDLKSLRTDPRWEKLLERIIVPPIRITENLTKDPRKAPFVYEDVHNFMHAMELVSAGEPVLRTLQTEYFGKGTPGLKQFVEKYGLTAEAVASAIKKRPEKYEQLGERLEQLKKREESLRSSLVRVKEVVPQIVFPPTYFLVSDYGGVASGSPDGQLITLERRTSESIAHIETLLIHELIHFQQLCATGPDAFYSLFGEKKTLLGLTIREGAAEFITNRVTGRMTQGDAYDYVLEHEDEVWRRFEPQMMDRETRGWMWSKPDNPDQPRDVAYAIGSRIVEAYYNRASDKGEAIQEILSVTNYLSFLKKSGYARIDGSQ